MSNNDTANRVSVDESHIEDEGDKVVMKDDGLEVEVEHSKQPIAKAG